MPSREHEVPGSAWRLRLATDADVRAIAELIPASVRGLQSGYYTEAQMEGALGPVFGVDRQLIADGTYCVAEADGRIVGCGGWSRRRALYGGGGVGGATAEALDPGSEPARVRAFFVHPDWARRGIGRAILAACERAIPGAGFRRIELVATLAGEPLYAACGYAVLERYEVGLPGGLRLPVVRMGKHCG